MTLISQILLVIVNVFMAKYHAQLIKSYIKIEHSIWAFFYLVLCGCVWLITGNHWVAISGLLIRKIVFDTSLNLFLGFSPFRVSKETSSIVDIWHYKLFGKRSEIYFTFYILVIIYINIFKL